MLKLCVGNCNTYLQKKLNFVVKEKHLRTQKHENVTFKKTLILFLPATKRTLCEEMVRRSTMFSRPRKLGSTPHPYHGSQNPDKCSSSSRLVIIN